MSRHIEFASFRETTLISGACYRQDIFFTSTTSFLLPSFFLPSFLPSSFLPPSFLPSLYLTSSRSCHPHTQLPNVDEWVSCIGGGEKGENQARHERGERENEKRSTRVINFHEGRVALRAVFVPQENYRLSADSSESSTCFKLPHGRTSPRLHKGQSSPEMHLPDKSAVADRKPTRLAVVFNTLVVCKTRHVR